MKTYVKPDVYYEDFEMSHSVASCALDSVGDGANFHTIETCIFNVDGDILFEASNKSCQYTPDDVGYEGYCYQTGAGQLNFFAS